MYPSNFKRLLKLASVGRFVNAMVPQKNMLRVKVSSAEGDFAQIYKFYIIIKLLLRRENSGRRGRGKICGKETHIEGEIIRWFINAMLRNCWNTYIRVHDDEMKHALWNTRASGHNCNLRVRRKRYPSLRATTFAGTFSQRQYETIVICIMKARATARARLRGQRRGFRNRPGPWQIKGT